MIKVKVKFWDEFKNFAFKGNMIELAVGVIIGTAFGAVVNSLVKNVIMPALSYIIPNQQGYKEWHLGLVKYGEFMGDILNFLIVAAAVFFMIVKVVGFLTRKPPAPPAAPTTKECPFCLSTIPIKASKCAHCTSELPVTA